MLCCICDICDSEMLSNRTEGNGHKLEQEKFWLCAWEKNRFTKKMVKCWSKFPRVSILGDTQHCVRP